MLVKQERTRLKWLANFLYATEHGQKEERIRCLEEEMVVVVDGESSAAAQQELQMLIDEREGLLRVYLEEWCGFYSMNIQKPRAMEFEDVQVRAYATEGTPATNVRTGYEVFDQEVKKFIKERRLARRIGYD
jgi:broad specificity polyphosphatase/5'/3'-nucleotidase SurE